MSIRKKLYTYAEFEQIARQPDNRDRRLELVHGEIIDVSPSFPHAKLAHLFSLHLGMQNLKHQWGTVLIEARYKLPKDDHNAFIPDLSVVKDTSDFPDKGPIPRMPELAIEIQSPDDSEDDLRERAAYYLANGALLVWLAFTDKKQIEVHRPGKEVIVLGENDTLDGGDVLPGFSLAVSVLFA